MPPHQLGLELRQLVLRARHEGRGLDTRTLQAAIGDLCGAEHGDLVAPLRYLVLSAAFASAAGQDPPLADPRLLSRLEQELAEMFAAPLCQRLQPLLEGLLGMASPPAAMPTPWGAAAMPAAAAAGAEHAPLTALPPVIAPGAALAASPAVAAGPAARPAGTSPLNVVLAFVSGMLLMALAGIGLWMQQRPQPRTASGPPPAAGVSPSGAASTPAPPPAAATNPEPDGAAPTSQPPSPAAATSDSAAAVTEAAALDRSLASVNALYEALSAKDYPRARSLIGGAAADQFDPAFFDQFARVSVQDLRLTSQTGSSVYLEGVVSFLYADGSLQSETRTFTLDSSSDPPRIIASAFGRVIKPR